MSRAEEISPAAELNPIAYSDRTTREPLRSYGVAMLAVNSSRFRPVRAKLAGSEGLGAVCLNCTRHSLRGVGQKVSDEDDALAREIDPVIGDRIVQIEKPPLDELHDDDRGKGLSE
jgi:hypothetical protein